MSIDRNTFESIYAGQPRWEIGRPQKAFTDVADQLSGRFSIRLRDWRNCSLLRQSRPQGYRHRLPSPADSIAKQKATDRNLMATSSSWTPWP